MSIFQNHLIHDLKPGLSYSLYLTSSFSIMPSGVPQALLMVKNNNVLLSKFGKRIICFYMIFENLFQNLGIFCHLLNT